MIVHAFARPTARSARKCLSRREEVGLRQSRKPPSGILIVGDGEAGVLGLGGWLERDSSVIDPARAAARFPQVTHPSELYWRPAFWYSSRHLN